GVMSIPMLYLAGFVLGSLETLVDSASEAILPAIVADSQLERANSWLVVPFVVGNQMAAKPVGAYLFVIGAAVPFGVDAVSFLVAAAFLAPLRFRPAAADTRDDASQARSATSDSRAGGRNLRSEIGEGLRGLWSRPILRSMALCLCVGNVLFCAAF